MKKVYESNNGWAIYSQEDLFGGESFSIYRYYPETGWTPFKHMAGGLHTCFLFLQRGGLISSDEYNFQINKLER
jgi:hypothetical protein